MKRDRRHIGVFLALVFFSPIVFQSVHTLWHHSHGYHCEHHCCHHDLCEMENIPEGIGFSSEEEMCPICEYHFSLNIVTPANFLNIEIPVFSYTFNDQILHQKYKEVFSDKSPRAPPVFFS